MTPTLIVLGLVALGVGIVVWATRRQPSNHAPTLRQDSDTAWNDPVAPEAAPAPADPFSHAPSAAVPPAEDPRP